jgi:NAD(P)-dependent dehydrogenase (short-subunit alcohol dehydrogenase family)
VNAAWGLTAAIREQFAPRGITVSGLHVGYMAASAPAEQKTGLSA